MRFVTVRRISQIFFFLLFLWFCIVTAAGKSWWNISGWPVNGFLWSDPLSGLGVVLTTWTFYWPFFIAAAVVILTVVFGRFFCGWVCPFGSLHQLFGWLGRYNKKTADKIRVNNYSKWQVLKYYILAVVLLSAVFPGVHLLLTGLLDPIPLVSRSFNLVIVALVDNGPNVLSTTDRLYAGGWVFAGLFILFILLNAVVPRFFCRFVCPLGALFGILGSVSIFRIGKNSEDNINCRLCEKNCEGGCEPAGEIKINECVLCFNCRGECKHNLISYQLKKSDGGEAILPDISRRGFLSSIAAGILVVPAVRLSGRTGDNWDNSIIRPPGSLDEKRFLERCIKCGQCMKICPTNVIQPLGVDKGLAAMWTPGLNNRIGTSGCQLNCVACGYVCPTAAIRAISLDEKHGEGDFSGQGPVRLGTAFVDRGRCLPWAMGKPCIVCQENCPVSPKAIFTSDTYQVVRNGEKTVNKGGFDSLSIEENDLSGGEFASGDYYLAKDRWGNTKVKITGNDSSMIKYTDGGVNFGASSGEKVYIMVRLQRPVVDIEKCIGCGICEHECPVSGKRAIRVTADGETRDTGHKIFL